MLYVIVPEVVSTAVFMIYLSAISSDEPRFDGSNVKPDLIDRQGQLRSQFVRQEIVGVP
jgi:hypothetical protein